MLRHQRKVLDYSIDKEAAAMMLQPSVYVMLPAGTSDANIPSQWTFACWKANMVGSEMGVVACLIAEKC